MPSSVKFGSLGLSQITHLFMVFCELTLVECKTFSLTLLDPGEGAESDPPTKYFIIKHLKHIERFCNFQIFPKFGFQTD